MPEALVELYKLFIDHGVAYEFSVEVFLLHFSWQLAMKQGIAAICEIPLFCQLIDAVPV